MEVSFCLCRAANHVRGCHFVAFHTSYPLHPPPSSPRGHKQRWKLWKPNACRSITVLPTLPQTHLWYFCRSTEQAVFCTGYCFCWELRRVGQGGGHYCPRHRGGGNTQKVRLILTLQSRAG
jgi:hypothetical protein